MGLVSDLVSRSSLRRRRIGLFVGRGLRYGMVFPQHTRKLLRPSTFGFIKPSPKALENHSICHLGFSIGLQVAHRHELMINVQINVEFPKFLVVKLSSIICDDDAGEPKVANDKLPKRRLDLAFHYMH